MREKLTSYPEYLEFTKNFFDDIANGVPMDDALLGFAHACIDFDREQEENESGQWDDSGDDVPLEDRLAGIERRLSVLEQSGQLGHHGYFVPTPHVTPPSMFTVTSTPTVGPPF